MPNKATTCFPEGNKEPKNLIGTAHHSTLKLAAETQEDFFQAFYDEDHSVVSKDGEDYSSVDLGSQNQGSESFSYRQSTVDALMGKNSKQMRQNLNLKKNLRKACEDS